MKIDKDFNVNVIFNEEGEEFQKILEKIIFNRIKNNIEEL